MAEWIKELPEAAQTYLAGNLLDEVECVIPDLPGIARGKAVPSSKFARQDYCHLPDFTEPSFANGVKPRLKLVSLNET